MEPEILKEKLSHITYKNLRLNDEGNTEYFKKIRTSFNITDSTNILAFIDIDYEHKGERGIAILNEGLKWQGIPEETDEDVDELKYLWQNGEISFQQLGSFKCMTQKYAKHFGVDLENRSIKDFSQLRIQMVYKYNPAETESIIQQDFSGFQNLFNLLISVAPMQEQIPDEYSAECVNAFITGTKASCEYYKAAFSWYAEKDGNFRFFFSSAGFLFGAINLIHRKLYVAAAGWFFLCLTLIIVFGGSSGILQILIAIAAAFVNPFWVYRRFRKILLQCHNLNLTHEQTIENLKLKGGANQLTNAIYDSPIFTILKIIFMILIILEIILWVFSFFI